MTPRPPLSQPPGPLHIDTGVVRSHGEILTGAAREASTALARSRDSAEAARPGFPGEAAGPFSAMLAAFEAQDRALTEAIDRAGSRVGSAADIYEQCEQQNLDQLDNAWLEF